MGERRLELRTHVADKLILEVHRVQQIAECRVRIADGWEALKGGQYEKGQSLFSRVHPVAQVEDPGCPRR